VSDDTPHGIPHGRLDQLRGQLVGGIPRFERRRRRVRVAQAAAAVGLVGVLAAAVTAAQGSTDGSEGRVTTGVERGECPEGRSGYSVDPLPEGPDGAEGPDGSEGSDGGVPVVLVASNINSESVAVADLDRGCLAVYPAGTHTMGHDVLAAAFTNRDQLVAEAWATPPLTYPAGRTPEGQQVLVDGGLAEPGDRLPDGVVGDVFPTDSGEGAWFLPDTADPSGEKPLGFVDLATGEIRHVNVPGGSLLVDVDGDDAILHPAATVSAGAGSVTELSPGHDMLRVTPSGDTSTLAAPEGASFVARAAGRTIWIAGGLRFRDAYCPCADRVIVVADDGTTTTIPVPDGEGAEGGQWRDGGHRELGSPPLRTVTRDGARLVLQLTNPDQPETTPTRLAVVDLEAGTADAFPVPGGTAFWAGDDRTAIVVGDGAGDTVDNTVTAVDTATGATTSVDGAVPEGFGLIAAR
jgi:hypothetical protein